MREKTLTRMIRVALVPALTAGVCLAAVAQNSSMTQEPTATGTQATANAHSMSATGKTAQNSGYRGMRASKVIGMEVRNPKGENIGKINDLVVNMRTGDVRYSILEFDPGIFKGEKLFAVPTQQLRMGKEGDTLVYNMTRDKLEKAGVERAGWDKTFRDPSYLRNQDRAWGMKQPSDGALAHRVSDLIGKDVRSRAGDDIGEIEDLVINMGAQKVHYAVLSFDPSMLTGEKRYLFPLRSFGMKADDDELTLNVDKDMLARMKSYPADGYDSLNDQAFANEIDRYFVAVVPVMTASTGNSGSMQKGQDQGTSNAAMDSNFKRMDTNGDGQISKEEFAAHGGMGMKRSGRSDASTMNK